MTTNTLCKYISCVPCQGADSLMYVASDYSAKFSASHLEFERENGNLRRVEFVRFVEEESEIQAGELVCFGFNTSIWKEV